MTGSLLYWLYSFANKPKTSSVIVPEIIASIFAGLIAYLFAGFDLLGLKLDPNVLRTYPLLGFLFAYAFSRRKKWNRYEASKYGRRGR